jgi:hypothetical protein
MLYGFYMYHVTDALVIEAVMHINPSSLHKGTTSHNICSKCPLYSPGQVYDITVYILAVKYICRRDALSCCKQRKWIEYIKCC